jgi:putative ABC transport system ATP-binding protein
MHPMIFEIEGLTKRYRIGSGELEVLRDVSLTVGAGEKTAIVGASGSGKSTLLNILGGLDRPTAGTVRFEGVDLYRRPELERARLRARRIGFVFQAFHLLPELTLLENVMLPAWTSWNACLRRRAHEARARELIARVGLGERMVHLPRELSGGEQQRAAIARALMNDPDVILADEPTGNLDSAAGEQVLSCLFDLAGDAHRTVLLVTHNPELARRCDRILTLRDGRLDA